MKPTGEFGLTESKLDSQKTLEVKMGLFGPSKQQLAERAAREQNERLVREKAERERREALRKEKEPVWMSLLGEIHNSCLIPKHLLLEVSDWESWSPDLVLFWLREHQQFIHLARALEVCGRFGEALALIEKLGPASYFEYFRSNGTPVRTGEYVNMGGVQAPLDWSSRVQTEAYQRKVAQLRGLCSAVTPNLHNPPVSDLNELEERYAYGEVTKTEYERLKAQIVRKDSQRCGRCGTPVEPNHNFCPRCGEKLTMEQEADHRRQFRA